MQALDAVVLHQVDQGAELADVLHVIFPVGRLENLKMLHSIVGLYCGKESQKHSQKRAEGGESLVFRTCWTPLSVVGCVET